MHFSSFISNSLIFPHRHELLSVHHHCECSKKSISNKTSEWVYAHSSQLLWNGIILHPEFCWGIVAGDLKRLERKPCCKLMSQLTASTFAKLRCQAGMKTSRVNSLKPFQKPIQTEVYCHFNTCLKNLCCCLWGRAFGAVCSLIYTGCPGTGNC